VALELWSREDRGGPSRRIPLLLGNPLERRLLRRRILATDAGLPLRYFWRLRCLLRTDDSHGRVAARLLSDTMEHPTTCGVLGSGCSPAFPRSVPFRTSSVHALELEEIHGALL
jgi:hypothetical protein